MKKLKNKKSEATPVSSQVSVEKQEEIPTKFVVVRDGYRVSDKEYDSEKDESAISECEFWSRIATYFSCGERVQIVQYDAKKHRVW